MAPPGFRGLFSSGRTRISPCKVWMSAPAVCHSASLLHWKPVRSASAMRQPWAKPKRVSTALAPVRPSISTSCLRSIPIATASRMSARSPAKRTPSRGSTSSSVSMRRSLARMGDPFILEEG